MSSNQHPTIIKAVPSTNCQIQNTMGKLIWGNSLVFKNPQKWGPPVNSAWKQIGLALLALGLRPCLNKAETKNDSLHQPRLSTCIPTYLQNTLTHKN